MSRSPGDSTAPIDARAAQDFVVVRSRAQEAVAHADRLRTIFRDAVTAAGPAHYGPAQCAAWSTSADDVDRWTARLRDGVTWIAAPVDRPSHAIGFATSWPVDHVDLLYVDPAWHRRGVATALLDRLVAAARGLGIAALATDASLLAHPVFARHGFAVVAWEDVERHGQVFRRATMRKVL